MADYLEGLSDDDLIDLEIVLDPDVAPALRYSGNDAVIEDAASNVDKIIKNAPKLAESRLLYRSYADAEGLRLGGELEEGAFLSGSTEKLEEGTVIAVLVPSGTPALILPDNGIVIARNQRLLLQAKESGPVPALLSGALTASAPILRVYPLRPNEEFHLQGQHDQSTHGKGGGGSAVGAADPKGKVDRKKVLKVIGLGAAAVAVTAGLILFSSNKRVNARRKDYAEVEEKLVKAGFPPGTTRNIPRDSAAKRALMNEADAFSKRMREERLTKERELVRKAANAATKTNRRYKIAKKVAGKVGGKPLPGA